MENSRFWLVAFFFGASAMGCVDGADTDPAEAQVSEEDEVVAARPEPGGMASALPPLPALPPGAGTGTTYYVSPTGNDANDGKSTSTPWKTLTKINNTTFAPGDTVLLQGGATFTGCLVFGSGKVKSTADAPFTLGSYGTGSFQLNASATNCTETKAAITISGINGFVLNKAKLVGNNGGAKYGVWIRNTGVTSPISKGVRIQNSDISGFYAASVSDFGGEIFLDGTYGGGLDDVKILNNTLHGSLGPTSPDENGINGFAANNNISNVLYQGNVIYHMGGKAGAPNGTVGNGIILNGVNGGVAQHNIVYSSGRNTTTCGGPAGIWAYKASNITIQYNEVYDIAPVGAPGNGCDWNAFDLDASVTNSVVQYNYSHNNFGAAFLAYLDTTGAWSSNTYRYNISEKDGAGFVVAGYKGTTTTLRIYNNTVYAPKAHAFEIALSTSGSIGGFVANNIFHSPGKDFVHDVHWNMATADGLEFLKNDYWTTGTSGFRWKDIIYTSLSAWAAATGKEMRNGVLRGLTVDPALQNPGVAGTIGGYNPASLSGYLLKSPSPVRSVGVNVNATWGVNVGTTDFFGKAIGSSGYNIGADGSPP